MQAVAIARCEEDARDAWVAMNRINAPWAAVFDGARLVGVLNRGDIDPFLRVPETFRCAGAVAREGMPARRGVSLSPDADLSEALLRLEMAGSDAAFVAGAPPGVMEAEAARRALARSGSSGRGRGAGGPSPWNSR